MLEKVSKVKSKYNKPLLITEIGFRSVESPWTSPHEEAGNKTFNEEDQATAYSAVFKALEQKPVIDGIFWWKWPTNLEPRNWPDRRFIPYDKKSQQVIGHWFKTRVSTAH